MAEQKLIGILIAIGLILVAGIFAVIDRHQATPDKPVSTTVSVAPAVPKDTKTGAVSPPKGQADDQLKQAPWSGKIMVAKHPVKVLAAPSSSASAMYGFPAGRPFRAIGRENGFVRIQDVKSGASGWIEEAALAPAPEKPAATRTRTPATSAKGTPTRKKSTAEALAPADTEPAPAPRRRRGLFGGGGIFGGLFGGQ
jgi:hypothetical protein